MNKHHFTKRNRISVFESLGGIDFGQVKAELELWPDGTEGYLTLHKVGKSKSPEELGYYYGVILPEAFEAFKDDGRFNLGVHVRGVSVTMPISRTAIDILLKARYGAWQG